MRGLDFLLSFSINESMATTLAMGILHLQLIFHNYRFNYVMSINIIIACLERYMSYFAVDKMTSHINIVIFLI